MARFVQYNLVEKAVKYLIWSVYMYLIDTCQSNACICSKKWNISESDGAVLCLQGKPGPVGEDIAGRGAGRGSQAPQ